MRGTLLYSALGLTCMLAASAAACTDSLGPTAGGLEGEFALVRIDGKSLPDTEPGLEPLDPRESRCDFIRSSGRLLLDPTSASFSIRVDMVRVCDGVTMNPIDEFGTYSQSGNSLMLIERYVDRADTLSGVITADTIHVDGVVAQYTFQR